MMCHFYLQKTDTFTRTINQLPFIQAITTATIPQNSFNYSTSFHAYKSSKLRIVIRGYQLFDKKKSIVANEEVKQSWDGIQNYSGNVKYVMEIAKLYRL